LLTKTSGLEMEWDYSGKNGKNGQKKKKDGENKKRLKGKGKRVKMTK